MAAPKRRPGATVAVPAIAPPTTANTAPTSPWAAVGTTGMPFNWRATVPDERVEHLISDEELNVLARGTKNTLRDILLCAAGALAGSICQFAKTMEALWRTTNPENMNGEHFFAIVVTLVALAVVVLTGVLIKFGREGDDVDTMVTKIRGRTNSLRLGQSGSGP